MSYTIIGKPIALATDTAKQARVPAVIQALAAKYNWKTEEVRDKLIIYTEEKRKGFARVTYDPVTCSFSGNEDYPEVCGILGKLIGPISQRRASTLSDVYETVDAAIAIEQAQGWAWEWVSETSVQIHDVVHTGV